jgi:hypothetical protein
MHNQARIHSGSGHAVRDSHLGNTGNHHFHVVRCRVVTYYRRLRIIDARQRVGEPKYRPGLAFTTETWLNKNIRNTGHDLMFSCEAS